MQRLMGGWRGGGGGKLWILGLVIQSTLTLS